MPKEPEKHAKAYPLYLIAFALLLLSITLYLLQSSLTAQDLALRLAAIALLSALGFAWIGIKFAEHR